MLGWVVLALLGHLTSYICCTLVLNCTKQQISYRKDYTNTHRLHTAQPNSQRHREHYAKYGIDDCNQAEGNRLR